MRYLALLPVLALALASCSEAIGPDQSQSDSPPDPISFQTVVGTCPPRDNFYLREAVGIYQSADRNEDGYVCRVSNVCPDIKKCGRSEVVAVVDNNRPIHGECVEGSTPVEASMAPVTDLNDDQVICQTAVGETLVFTDNSS